MKTKNLHLLILITFLLGWIQIFAQSRPVADVWQVSSTITLDGLTNEWSEIPPVSIEKSFNGETPTLTSATWKAVWDNEGIYVCVEVNDDIWAPSWVSGSVDWQSDKIEVYFDVTNPQQDGGGASGGSGNYQLAPNYPENQQGEEIAFIQGSPWPANGIKYSGTYDGNGKSCMEYFIPFSDLLDQNGNPLLPVINETIIGFDVNVVDNDVIPAYRNRAVWSNVGNQGENWFNLDEVGLITFRSNNINQLLANFNSDLQEGNAPLFVEFFDESIGSPTHWNWDFGDGSTSDIQNPTHTYKAAGIYTVSLTVSNDSLSNMMIRTDYLTVLGKPSANVYFTNTAITLDGDASEWDAIAGNDINKPFQMETPSLISATWKAVWNTEGVYVCVNVEDDIWAPSWISGSADWASDRIEVYFDVTNPQQDGGSCYYGLGNYFIAPNYPESQQGEKLSYSPVGAWTATGIKYAGTFDGNGNSCMEYFVPFSDLTDQDGHPISPVIDETTIGFDVTIVDNDVIPAVRNRAVWANIGEIDESWNNTDDVGLITFTSNIDNQLTANFYSNISEGNSPLLVQFFDNSIGSPNQWNWDFGDGTTSNIQNPSHTYSVAGSYNVSLTISNESSTNTLNRTNYITVSGKSAVNIYYTNKPITLDGVASEWDDIIGFNIDKPFLMENPTLNSAVWKAAWNAEGIYVCVNIDDDTWSPSWVSGSADWQSDKIELYFDVTNPQQDGGGASAGLGNYQLAPNYPENQQGEIIDFSSSDIWPATGIKYAGTYDNNGKSCMEYFVPYADLLDQFGNAISPIVNETVIGFDVNVSDNDVIPAVRNRAVWANIGNVMENWSYCDDVGLITLRENPNSDSVAKLISISINEVQVESFQSDVFNYSIFVPGENPTIPVVTAVASSSLATVVISQAQNLSGTEVERTAIINVVSADLSNTSTYSVVFSSCATLNVDKGITINGTTLTANATDVVYQWVDCNNKFLALENETNQSFTATLNGSYAVKITLQGCEYISDCHEITGISVIENQGNLTFDIYPNPAQSQLFINSPKAIEKAEVLVMNVLGEVVMQKEMNSTNHLMLDMNALQSGVYYIRIQTIESFIVYKVIKK